MEIFTIYVKFSNDDTMEEAHNEDTLLGALERLTFGPAANGGLIKEVKVVDMMDCTNFLWQKGRVVFPRPGVQL